ncbi:winged helix-turn-helix transcriptional regulator [Kushneria indalinina]|uniref:HxlR family transcriptional regulator n=1 Tax=Kushneria indalinina DSM 14324 TaxID=1122140 RepID=A0A3D9E1V4_9GAMM|nr:helix-turn-helix domain-containing protein [Kushneria indalinina]REC96434.1 HxlR family transcriptional regulator [Kushneria indalinina DSM 14324]
MIPHDNDELLARSRALCNMMKDEDDWLKREVLSHAGNRWAFGVIHVLKEGGRLRHAEIRRRLEGVTQRMLTRTLRQLERDGLILRTDHEEVSPRVEYELTPLGEAFLLQIIPMWLWIFEHAEDFRQARDVYSKKPSE